MQTLKVVTYNMRYDCQADGQNNFEYRKPYMIKKIKEKTPDVIGFQEMLPHMKSWFEESFPEYHLVGCGRAKDYTDEHNAIAYKKETFELLGLETFWLSPTPYLPGSRFEEQSICPRVCTMALLKPKEGRQPIRVYNTHLDHEGEEARILGIRLVLERMKQDYEKFPLPSVLMGDFNATPDSNEIQIIEKESSLKDVTRTIPYTFHDFGRLQRFIKIDYIYMSQDWSCHQVEVWDDVEEGIYLSDHYPVQADLALV